MNSRGGGVLCFLCTLRKSINYFLFVFRHWNLREVDNGICYSNYQVYLSIFLYLSIYLSFSIYLLNDYLFYNSICYSNCQVELSIFLLCWTLGARTNATFVILTNFHDFGVLERILLFIIYLHLSQKKFNKNIYHKHQNN